MRRFLRRILVFCLMSLCLSAAACAQTQQYHDLTAACRDVRAAVYDRQTHIAFSLTDAAVSGRHQSAIRDILTDVLEGFVDYTIGFSQQDSALHVTINGTLRPALNILHAWETGDFSALTKDELRCMDIALEIAQECRKGAENALEIERAVYDAVCRHVDYFRGENPPAFGSKEYIRLHTSVGALLDGYTQCLGYSEVFYLISRLAGLDVQMQYGFPGGASSGKHAWNTVHIAGRDYMTDVCWGDSSADLFELTTPNYRYLNVGEDHQPSQRHPHPEAQIAEISETTDWSLTAFGAAGGGVIANTLEEAVRYAIAQHNAHQPYAHVFIRDAQIALDEVDSLMWARVKAEGIATTWGRMTYDFAGGTYVIFRWVLN